MKSKTKEEMITDILQVCAISDLVTDGKCPVTGQLFLSLATASKSALISICSELYIPTTVNI
jgi:hypothetical protein